jgi:hypothetical protein
MSRNTLIPASPVDALVVLHASNVLCWLPDIRRWAAVVAGLLRPGGRLFCCEGHPMLWTLDDERDDDLLVVRYPYFEREQPLTFEDAGTYVETDAVFRHNVSYEWNHGLGESVTALLEAGMDITALTEHDSLPWEALPAKMDKAADGEWRLARLHPTQNHAEWASRHQDAGRVRPQGGPRRRDGDNLEHGHGDLSRAA